MKQLFTLLFIMSLFIAGANAQTRFQSYYSSNTGYNSGLSMDTTSDGGYVMTGNHNSSTGGSIDAFIFKTDSSGALEWSKKVGDARTDILFSVKQVTNGNIITAGYSNSFSVDSVNQFYMMKLNSSGSILWQKVYVANPGIIMQGKRVIQTSDGGLIIGGSKQDSRKGMVYLKTDSSGVVLWGKYIESSTLLYGLESIRETADNGFIISGNGDLVIKVDSMGDVTWSKTYITGAKILSVEQTAEGGYIMAGETTNWSGSHLDMFLIKTDSSGNVVWCNTYGGGNNDYFGAAFQSSDGGYIIGGSSLSFGSGSFDMIVIKTDSAGNTLWSKTYGGAGGERVSAAYETADGWVFGGLTSSFGNLLNNSYIVKTDFNGNSGCHQTSPTVMNANPVLAAVTASNVASSFVPVAVNSFATSSAGPVANGLCYTTGINRINDEKFEIGLMPNPAHNIFTITFKNRISSGKIEMYNSLGELILSENVNHESLKVISTENAAPGIYIICVKDGENIASKKILIE